MLVHSHSPQHDSTGRDIHDQVSAALSLDEPYLFGLAIVKGVCYVRMYVCMYVCMHM